MSGRKIKIVSRPRDKLHLQMDKGMSSCNAPVFAISSPVSFSGIAKMLWEVYLRLEVIDLWKVLTAPEETSPVLKGVGWGENTPMQRQEASQVQRKSRTMPQKKTILTQTRP